MRRWPYSILAAASLLSCVAIFIVWVCGQRRIDRLAWRTGTITFQVASGNGHLSVAWFHAWPHDVQFEWRVTPVSEDTGGGLVHSVKGKQTNIYVAMVYEGVGRLSTSESRSVQVPYRIVSVKQVHLITLSIAPCLSLAGVYYLQRRRAAARVMRGLCRSCGYDLRASTDCCPECGTAIPPRPPAAEGATA